MAPGGQGTLVDVCKGRTPLSIPGLAMAMATPPGPGWGPQGSNTR